MPSTDITLSISGISIIVLPDDDDRFLNIPPNNVGMGLDRMIVRESEWPNLRDLLINSTKVAQS